MHIIYAVINNANRKKYVGYTSDPKRRWNEHRTKSHNPLLRAAMEKYGKESFEFVILARYSTKDEALAAEGNWISRSNSLVSGHGYNIAPGGTGGWHPTPERLSDLGSGRCTNCGREFQRQVPTHRWCTKHCRSNEWARHKYQTDDEFRDKTLTRNNSDPDKVSECNRHRYQRRRDIVLARKRDRIARDPEGYRARERGYVRKARAKRQTTACSAAEAMCRPQLRNGDEFRDVHDHLWRVTDVGRQTFAAIDLTSPDQTERWFRRVAPVH